jgi:hypothetical protein
MNQWSGRLIQSGVLALFLCASLATGGCEGTDTRDTVDNTVEEMAGKKDLERYQQMKDNLDEIQTQQTEMNRRLNEAAE